MKVKNHVSEFFPEFVCFLAHIDNTIESITSNRGVNKFLEIFGIPIRNQNSGSPKPEISLKNRISRTLNVEVIYPSQAITECLTKSIKN